VGTGWVSLAFAMPLLWASWLGMSRYFFVNLFANSYSPAVFLGSLAAIQLTKSNSYIGIRIRTCIKSGRSSAPFNMGEQASERAGQARQQEAPGGEPGASLCS